MPDSLEVPSFSPMPVITVSGRRSGATPSHGVTCRLRPPVTWEDRFREVPLDTTVDDWSPLRSRPCQLAEGRPPGELPTSSGVLRVRRTISVKAARHCLEKPGDCSHDPPKRGTSLSSLEGRVHGVPASAGAARNDGRSLGESVVPGSPTSREVLSPSGKRMDHPPSGPVPPRMPSLNESARTPASTSPARATAAR